MFHFGLTVRGKMAKFLPLAVKAITPLRPSSQLSTLRNQNESMTRRPSDEPLAWPNYKKFLKINVQKYYMFNVTTWMQIQSIFQIDEYLDVKMCKCDSTENK